MRCQQRSAPCLYRVLTVPKNQVKPTIWRRGEALAWLELGIFQFWPRPSEQRTSNSSFFNLTPLQSILWGRKNEGRKVGKFFKESVDNSQCAKKPLWNSFKVWIEYNSCLKVRVKNRTCCVRPNFKHTIARELWVSLKKGLVGISKIQINFKI